MRTSERTIRLRAPQRKRLEALLRGRELSAREQTRARVLLLSDSGWKKEAITEACGASRATIGRVRRHFREGGVDEAVWEGVHRGALGKFTPSQQQRIVALVCTNPPEGSSRWTVRLLAEETVRRGITKSIGRESVRVILRDHDMKPWREKNVVHS